MNNNLPIDNPLKTRPQAAAIGDYIFEDSVPASRRATPDTAGKARPTVNRITVMNYVKLNKWPALPIPVRFIGVGKGLDE